MLDILLLVLKSTFKFCCKLTNNPFKTTEKRRQPRNWKQPRPFLSRAWVPIRMLWSGKWSGKTRVRKLLNTLKTVPPTKFYHTLWPNYMKLLKHKYNREYLVVPLNKSLPPISNSNVLDSTGWQQLRERKAQQQTNFGAWAHKRTKLIGNTSKTRALCGGESSASAQTKAASSLLMEPCTVPSCFISQRCYA